jgi:hypothetical protein
MWRHKITIDSEEIDGRGKGPLPLIASELQRCCQLRHEDAEALCRIFASTAALVPVLARLSEEKYDTRYQLSARTGHVCVCLCVCVCACVRVTTQGTCANKIHKLVKYQTAMAKSLVRRTFTHTMWANCLSSRSRVSFSAYVSNWKCKSQF